MGRHVGAEVTFIPSDGARDGGLMVMEYKVALDAIPFGFLP